MKSNGLLNRQPNFERGLERVAAWPSSTHSPGVVPFERPLKHARRPESVRYPSLDLGIKTTRAFRKNFLATGHHEERWRQTPWLSSPKSKVVRP